MSEEHLRNMMENIGYDRDDIDKNRNCIPEREPKKFYVVWFKDGTHQLVQPSPTDPTKYEINVSEEGVYWGVKS